MQNNKLFRGVLENDSIQHRHDPSTPKHNCSRKKFAALLNIRNDATLLNLNL